MGCSVLIHHGASSPQIPPSFLPRTLRATPSISLASSPVARHRRRWPRIRCSKHTDRADQSPATEEPVKASYQSLDEINNGVKTPFDSSSHDEQDSVTRKATSIRTVALWVGAAVTFGIALGFKDGTEKATEYFAGYLLEQTLSVDNLLVFVLIFKYFQVPKMYQSRVLSYGIAGSVIFRAIMILLGTATLQRFEVVNLLLASILLYSSYKLFSAEEEETDLTDNFIIKTCQKFIPVTDYYDGDRFITSQDGVWKATPLLLIVAVIELSDIAFAVDSIPAVFGVTKDPLYSFFFKSFCYYSYQYQRYFGFGVQLQSRTHGQRIRPPLSSDSVGTRVS